MMGDIARAVGQITDARFTTVLAKGVGLSLALLFAVTVLAAWGIGLLVPDSFALPWIGEITWIDNIASIAVIPIMLVASIFLMVPVASLFTGFFLDDVVDAVEAKHYPSAPRVAPLTIAQSLPESLRFFGVLVAVNLAALILYLIFAPFAPLIFWAVNGLLLGREYITLIAQRRLGADGARTFRKRHSMQIWMAGILMAIPLSIPLVNLTVPIIGAAAFTHVFHRLDGANPPGSPSRID